MKLTLERLNLRQLNEQSLALDVCNLENGFTKYAFRYLDLDIRQYGRIKMYSHAEAGSDNSDLEDGDISIVFKTRDRF